MGFARVRRLAITGGLPPDQMNDAIAWTARREEEERQREIASETEVKRIARSTLIAAWIAAIASIAAIAVTCLAWLFPRT